MQVSAVYKHFRRYAAILAISNKKEALHIVSCHCGCDNFSFSLSLTIFGFALPLDAFIT